MSRQELDAPAINLTEMISAVNYGLKKMRVYNGNPINVEDIITLIDKEPNYKRALTHPLPVQYSEHKDTPLGLFFKYYSSSCSTCSTSTRNRLLYDLYAYFVRLIMLGSLDINIRNTEGRTIADHIITPKPYPWQQQHPGNLPQNYEKLRALARAFNLHILLEEVSAQLLSMRKSEITDSQGVIYRIVQALPDEDYTLTVLNTAAEVATTEEYPATSSFSDALFTPKPADDPIKKAFLEAKADLLKLNELKFSITNINPAFDSLPTPGHAALYYDYTLKKEYTHKFVAQCTKTIAACKQALEDSLTPKAAITARPAVTPRPNEQSTACGMFWAGMDAVEAESKKGSITAEQAAEVALRASMEYSTKEPSL